MSHVIRILERAHHKVDQELTLKTDQEREQFESETWRDMYRRLQQDVKKEVNRRIEQAEFRVQLETRSMSEEPLHLEWQASFAVANPLDRVKGQKKVDPIRSYVDPNETSDLPKLSAEGTLQELQAPLQNVLLQPGDIPLQITIRVKEATYL